MKYFLTFLGRVFAALPECVVNAMCVCIGTLVAFFPSGRNRVAFSNISHCFPEMGEKEIRKIAVESARRMVEMALFVLASPYMSDARLKSKIKISDYVRSELEQILKNPRPTILMIPHFCMMETITMFPLMINQKLPRVGVFYRPFDSPSMEKWIKQSRERFGIELLSRKKGLSSALDFLRLKGCVAVLFDQNAGGVGTETLFFDRVCSSSEIAGLFVERTNCDCAIFYARRTGFWSSFIDGERMNFSSRQDVTIAANNWLERRLKSDEIARFDWLWLHRRWYVNRYPRECLHIKTCRSILARNLEFNGLAELPRTDRIFIVAPSSREGAFELLKSIDELRRSRPDAAVTLLCEENFSAEIAAAKVADEVLSIPSSAKGCLARLKFFASLRTRYPDILLTFQDGLFADIQARIVGAQMRLATQSGRRRRFMTAVFTDSANGGENFFRRALQYFGMNVVETEKLLKPEQ